MKYTNQRIEILNFLKDNFNHPSAEDVYDEVRKKLTRISRATVYQNLKFLSEKGMINELNIKGVSRFDPNLHPHHHFKCRECGRILDIDSEELTDYAKKVGEKIKNIEIESVETNFIGICDHCRRNKNGRKK